MTSDKANVPAVRVATMRQIDPVRHAIAKTEPQLPKQAFKRPTKREKRQMEEARIQITDVLVTEAVTSMAEAAWGNVNDFTNRVATVVTTRMHDRPARMHNSIARSHMVAFNQHQQGLNDRIALAILSAGGERLTHTVSKSSYEKREDGDTVGGLLGAILSRWR